MIIDLSVQEIRVIRILMIHDQVWTLLPQGEKGQETQACKEALMLKLYEALQSNYEDDVFQDDDFQSELIH